MEGQIFLHDRQDDRISYPETYMVFLHHLHLYMAKRLHLVCQFYPMWPRNNQHLHPWMRVCMHPLRLALFLTERNVSLSVHALEPRLGSSNLASLLPFVLGLG